MSTGNTGREACGEGKSGEGVGESPERDPLAARHRRQGR